MSVCDWKKTVLVPLVIPSHPWAKRWSSLLIALIHSEQGILDELPVVRNCLLRNRVYYTFAVFFNFDDGSCILILDKATGDCDVKGVSESQTNDMIQCLV